MQITGVAHVALTVTDLPRSKEWYGRVLEWSPVFEGSGDGVEFSVGTLPGGTLIGLREFTTGSGDAFSPFRTGLDHLALGVGTRDEVDGWERRFAELGVTYDPVQETPFGHVLNFKDPDGIALEVTAPLDPGQ